MEALKFIPQLFFDLIGRMVPGFLAMLLGLLVYYQTGYDIAWREITETSFWVLSIFAYIIGHLVAPLTKFIQRKNERFSWLISDDKTECPDDKKEEKDDLYAKKKNDKIRSQKYNWLRLNQPDAGGLCAKLRAEFTMYNSFSAIFLIFTIIEMIMGIANLIIGASHLTFWTTGAAFLVLFAFMAARGHEGEETFGKDVKKFYELADAPVID